MNKYNKQEESKEDHEEYLREQIEKLCMLAQVDYNDYHTKLSESKQGYWVVQRRDLDEININSYNIEWIRAHGMGIRLYKLC